jgi:hypothetical protein
MGTATTTSTTPISLATPATTPFRLTVVSHVWNYRRLFNYQVSSLVLNAPAESAGIEIDYVVFYCPDEDPKTDEYVGWWQGWFRDSHDAPGCVRFRPTTLPREQLLRRAIGRDLACRNLNADWLWMADCDYLVGPGTFEAAKLQLENVRGNLAYIRCVQSSVCHASGDADIARCTEPGIIQPCGMQLFKNEMNNRAIGGIQFLRGSVARERGYLPPGHRYLKTADRWRRTHEDKVVRSYYGTKGDPIELPGVFRIRHGKRGRFDVGVEL